MTKASSFCSFRKARISAKNSTFASITPDLIFFKPTLIQRAIEPFEAIAHVDLTHVRRYRMRPRSAKLWRRNVVVLL